MVYLRGCSFRGCSCLNCTRFPLRGCSCPNCTRFPLRGCSCLNCTNQATRKYPRGVQLSPLGFAACQSKNCTRLLKYRYVGAVETTAPPEGECSYAGGRLHRHPRHLPLAGEVPRHRPALSVAHAPREGLHLPRAPIAARGLHRHCRQPLGQWGRDRGRIHLCLLAAAQVADARGQLSSATARRWHRGAERGFSV